MYEIAHGQYSRALHDLSGVPSPGRTEAEQANLRGLALLLDGQPKKAIDSFDTALELRPDFGVSRFNRGIAFLRSDDYARASADFVRVASDPNEPLRASAEYHNALALDALGRPADADAAVERALAINPNFDDAILFAGVLAERRGDLEIAGKSYKAYLDRHPDSALDQPTIKRSVLPPISA